MITIHTISYNEEIMLPFFIKHYRTRFPNCIIKIYDNYSTDNSCKIAEENDCEIIKYDSNNQLSDDKYLEIKNNVWKESQTNWNLVCDVDELCDIWEKDLINEEEAGTSIIKFTAYDMVNKSTNPDNVSLETLTDGVRHPYHDKQLIFNKKLISEINYNHGCHNTSPIGKIKYSTKEYKLLHYKYIGENYLINRYKIFSQRMSEKNRINGWGGQYLLSENEIRLKYKDKQKQSIKIKL